MIPKVINNYLESFDDIPAAAKGNDPGPIGIFRLTAQGMEEMEPGNPNAVALLKFFHDTIKAWDAVKAEIRTDLSTPAVPAPADDPDADTKPEAPDGDSGTDA